MSPSLSDSLLGDYQILNMVGRGGMGEVYRARQITLDRIVAIKVLPSDFCSDLEYVNRFLLEAKGSARLNHPNLIQIIDAGMVGHIYFYVMEFVDGKNLSQIVKERGWISEGDALYLIQQTAIGLAFAHSKEVVHRDVKPENIMLTLRGMVKIGDLGLAKWKSQKKESFTTGSGAQMGTPYYICPEQIRGAHDIDGRADVYSLGMTLYHLLAGRPPFYEGTAAAIMAQHLSDPVPPLQLINPHVSRPTLDLIEAMTVKDREDRIQSMKEVAEITGEWLNTASFGHSLQHEVAHPSPALQIASERAQGWTWNKIFWTIVRPMSAVFLGLGVALVILLIVKPPPKPVIEKVEVVQLRKTWPPPGSGLVSRSIGGHQIFATSIRGPISDGSVEDDSLTYCEKFIPISEWVVGDALRRSKTLIRCMVPSKSPVKSTPEPLLTHFFTNTSHLVSAVLEITPERISKDCDLKIEVYELQKPWLTKNSFERSAWYLARSKVKPLSDENWQKVIGNPLFLAAEMKEIENACTLINAETTWKYASTSQGLEWELLGAGSPDEDYVPKPLKFFDSDELTSYRITPESLGKTIRVDLTPYFKKMSQAYQLESPQTKGEAKSAHLGWVIQPCGGQGEVFFYSNLRHQKCARILFLERPAP